MVSEAKKLEIVKGTLKSKEEKLSSGKRVYWLLDIEGIGKASVWDKKVADALQVGKAYEYETEYDGQYRTVKTAKETAIPVLPVPPPEHREGYIPAIKDSQAIMAQVALKSAVERANGIQSREITPSDIIEMAQQFYLAMRSWATGKLVNPTPSPSPLKGEDKAKITAGDVRRAQPWMDGDAELAEIFEEDVRAGGEPAATITSTSANRLPNLAPDWVKAVRDVLTAMGIKGNEKQDASIAKRYPGANTVAQLTMAEANEIIAHKPKQL